MKKVKINDIELAYRDEGSGQPIVFLHAFPLNQMMWDKQVTEFSSNNRVITFDFRGFGNSSSAKAKSTLPMFADDLAGLLDHLKIERATICGLSMGGYAAFSFFRKYVGRVSALILCDTRATADTDEARRGRYELADSVRSKGTSALIETMVPRLLGETTLQSLPQIAADVRAMIEMAQPEGVAQALIAMAERNDSTDLLGRIDCPVLIVVGNEDKLTPPDEVETMSKAIDLSKFEVVSNAGHLPNMEQTGIFNQIVGDFLRHV